MIQTAGLDWSSSFFLCREPHPNLVADAMKTRSRSESASPREVIRIRARKAEDLTGVCFRQLRNNSNEMGFAPAVPQLPTLTLQLNLDPLDPPKISLDNVELRLNMEQVDGLFKEQNSPERQRNSSLKGTPPVPRRGLSRLILSVLVLTSC